MSWVVVVVIIRARRIAERTGRSRGGAVARVARKARPRRGAAPERESPLAVARAARRRGGRAGGRGVLAAFVDLPEPLGGGVGAALDVPAHRVGRVVAATGEEKIHHRGV